MTSRSSAVAAGDELRDRGDLEGAFAAYAEGRRGDAPDPVLVLRLAQASLALGQGKEALRLALSIVDDSTSYQDWLVAASILRRVKAAGPLPVARRHAKVWIASSSTTVQFVPLLELAGLRAGISLEILAGAHNQYRQDILDPGSALYAAAPDVVVLAVHAGDLLLPPFAEDAEAAVSAELDRWTGLWRAFAAHSTARLVMHTFALPPQDHFGHLSARLPGAHHALMRDLNRRLGEQAGDRVLLVDCDRLASEFGTAQWFSPKYWHVSRQAQCFDALTVLARHTAAVIGGHLGLAKKCIAVDLDNTLWGGIVGEDGVEGLRIGPDDPDGEAFLAFQHYLKALQGRGILLAVCSKNNPEDAREVFTRRPEMVLKLDDFAAFEATWTDKAAGLRRIADTIGIGLDALVFLDDNPAERELVRQLVPDVEVLRLPPDPAGYVAALASSTFFEAATFTAEDRARSALYRSRADYAALSSAASSIDDFLASLQMSATVEPINAANVARAAQLLGKSNQFNLTTRRYTAEQLTGFAGDASYVPLAFRLADRIADHGLIGLIGGRLDGDTMEVDVFAMSCRVIGRTMENVMLDALIAAARERLCSTIRGVYLPTQKNAMVRDLYDRLGFEPVRGRNDRFEYLLPIERWTLGSRCISYGTRPAPTHTLQEAV